jgi:hypothetical protein
LRRLGAVAEQDKLDQAVVNQEAQPVPRAVERDLRLDLFRGVGLWMVFLDHIPHDVDASQLRLQRCSGVLRVHSGYLAGFIYGPIIGTGYLLAATKRLWTRAGQMYVAHIMLSCCSRPRSPARFGNSTTPCMRTNSTSITSSSTPTS